MCMYAELIQFIFKKKPAKFIKFFLHGCLAVWGSYKLQKDFIFVLSSSGLVWRKVFFPGGSARRGNVAAEQANTLHTGPIRPAGHKSCIAF
jgi:hypothetical protein